MEIFIFCGANFLVVWKMSLAEAGADVEMQVVGDGAGAVETGVGAGSPRLRDVDAGSFVGGALEEDQEGVNE